MAEAIWELEQLDLLQSFITRAYDNTIEIMSEGMDTIIDPETASLEEIYITGEWGRGIAESDERIEVFLFLDFEGILEPATSTPVQDFLTELEEGINIIAARDWEEGPEPLTSESRGLEINPVTVDALEGQLNRELGAQDGNTIFNLQTRQAVVQQGGVSFRNLERVPIEVLRGEEEPEEIEETEEEVEDETDEIEDVEDVEEVFEPTPDFPNVPPPIRDNATSPDEMEVTVGRKDTKTVPVRDMYDFEVIMATDRPNPQMIDQQADVRIVGDVLPDIGRAVAAGTLGTVGQRGERETPATFPRTGRYIRNYLKFEGPAYALQLHREILVYTAYINGIHDFELRTGTYNSMRRYLKALRQLEEFDIELIEIVPQQALAAMGIETIPDHPSIEGEKAPWLENRVYYDLVEENEDHPAWSDVFTFLEEIQDNGDQAVE